MAKQVRVAFVGSGGIATEAHLPALKEIDGVEIVALCDAQKERAEAAIAEQFADLDSYREYIESVMKKGCDP